eukprot:gene10035-20897_t
MSGPALDTNHLYNNNISSYEQQSPISHEAARKYGTNGPDFSNHYHLDSDTSLALSNPHSFTVEKLVKEIELLKEFMQQLKSRNSMKDKSKKFEGSWTRIGVIMAITYGTLTLYMTLIGVNEPFLNAVVPALGFNLSTWSLPHVKTLWIKWYDWNWGRGRNDDDNTLIVDDMKHNAFIVPEDFVELCSTDNCKHQSSFAIILKPNELLKDSSGWYFRLSDTIMGETLLKAHWSLNLVLGMEVHL